MIALLEHLNRVVGRARVIVCVGPGGVGKTSTSAAIALQGAHEGRRSLVLTIDPARRLANALGLPEIGNEEREIGERRFRDLGLAAPRGRLTAMMLDIKQTWDDVVLRYHPDAERRRRLLSNRLYEALSTALAGSQEYMAMEKLYELSMRSSDRLDLIVLDTPPASNAMDFLDAPSRILDALDNDATRWLLEPYLAKGRITSKLFDAGSSFFIRTISRFTGAELIEELAELLSCFQEMFEGFRERAKAVRAILASKDTSFLVISAPRPHTVDEARAFRERLSERGVRVGGLVLNRATRDVFEEAQVRADEALRHAVFSEGGSSELSRRLVEAAEISSRVASDERRIADALRGEAGEGVVVLVPELTRDIHDLVGLDALRAHLFA